LGVCAPTWKTWKSHGICQFWKTHGKLSEFKIYSGNLSDVCIIVSNSTLNWLGDTVTGMVKPGKLGEFYFAKFVSTLGEFKAAHC